MTPRDIDTAIAQHRIAYRDHCQYGRIYSAAETMAAIDALLERRAALADTSV